MIAPYLESSIVVLTGKPGGGKSFLAADLIREWMEYSCPVLSNLAIQRLPFKPGVKYGEFSLLHDADFTEENPDTGELRILDHIRRCRERNPGKHILVVIDEAPRYYPSQGWKTNPDAVKTFLQQHRHLDVSVLAISQHYGMLDNYFNRLCQEFRSCQNIVKIPILEIVLWWFTDNLHLMICYANSGGKPAMKYPYGRRLFRIRKKTRESYSTVQMHKSTLPGQRRKKKSYLIRWVGAAVGVGLTVLIFRAVFGEKAEVEQQALESVLVESIARVGDRLHLHVLGEQGERIIDLRYSEDLVWDLQDLVGTEINIGSARVEGRPMAELIGKEVMQDE